MSVFWSFLTIHEASTVLVAVVVSVLGALGIMRMREAKKHVKPLFFPIACVKKLVEWRLGGYKQLLSSGFAKGTETATSAYHVAVIGGGLAGLSAAIHLAEKGVRVTLFESADYLGGKCGSWRHTLPDGTPVWVDHGFHAIFKQYYNCRELFERCGVSKFYKTMDSYVVKKLDHSEIGFSDVDTTPLLNLLSLWRKGLFNYFECLISGTIWYLNEFLRYDPISTYKRFDGVTYDEFCEKAQMPEELCHIFQTFARAYFAEGDRLSMAEVLKAFHFFFLSHDGGLVYEYFNDSFHHAFVTPLRNYFEAKGGIVRLNSPVRKIDDAEAGLLVDGEHFQQAIIACDVTGLRSIMESTTLATLGKELSHVKPSQRYCTLRVWMNKQAGDSLPDFFVTQKKVMLDAICLCHRVDSSRKWAAETGGGVYELHSYCVPDRVSGEEEAREILLDELLHYLPELKEADVIDSYIQLNKNFSAFHCGMHNVRPSTRSSHERIKLAGDWVKMPCPATLLEAATTSGMLAANEVLADIQVNGHPVYTVPLKGIFP